MKTVILAGGLGTRLAEETEVKPKPLVEIGGQPILWHIMKSYTHYGFTDFVVALGYKGDVIKRFFKDYIDLGVSLRVDLKNLEVEQLDTHIEDWTLHLMDTGQDTMTGGRLKRVAHLLQDGTFMMTYGDGVANVPIDALVRFHKSHGKLATVTAVRPPARYGGLEFEGDRVAHFTEKPQVGEGWINGGFFVLEPGAIDYIDGDATHFEREPLERLAEDGQLMAYKHDDFWQCMDAMRDKRLLNSLWEEKRAPWKVWE